MQTIEAQDGFKVSIGDYVEFWGGGTHAYGTVRGFRGDNVLLNIDENRPVETTSGRWKLNPAAQASHGTPDYWEPRDNGVSLGCIKRPSWNWSSL